MALYFQEYTEAQSHWDSALGDEKAAGYAKIWETSRISDDEDRRFQDGR